jgi:DNA-binding NarL/FixJ family response regulator
MEEDFRIIAQCPDSDRLCQAIDAFRGVAVMFAATLKPNLKVLMERLSNAGSRAIALLENDDEPQPFLEAGVAGVIYRNVSSPVLVDCVRRVAGGECFQQPADKNQKQGIEDPVGERVRDRLTRKEMRIVGFIVQGCKNKEIAVKLGTTEQVVKNYLRSVYDKIGVSDRLELALFTLHHRILAEAAEAVNNPAVEVMA